LTLTNCIVAANTATTSGGDIYGTSLVSVGVCIVRQVYLAGKGSQIGNFLDADPLLSTLGDYGGPTQTCVPQGGSPAIDGTSLAVSGLYSDQRGFPLSVAG